VTTVLSIAAAVIAFSLLIIVHEAGHMGVARLLGMRVERFSVGFGPVLTRFRRGDTEYVLSALPLGGYVRIRGMTSGEEVADDDPTAYSNQRAWRRFLAIAAGPAMNYLAAVLVAAVLVGTVGLPSADPGPRVGDLRPDYPAALAGLERGDRVLSVAGEPVTSWRGLVDVIQRHPGESVAFEVERGEGAGARRLTLPVTPLDDGGVGRVGFQNYVTTELRSGPDALAAGLRLTNAHAAEQLAGLGRALQPRHRSELSGPVGIAQAMVRSAHLGWASLLAIAWEVSIALALLNLLPIPALDGGRLVFLAYEIVTRRRVNERVENFVHLAGFVALLALILAVTVFGDLPRLLHR